MANFWQEVEKWIQKYNKEFTIKLENAFFGDLGNNNSDISNIIILFSKHFIIKLKNGQPPNIRGLHLYLKNHWAIEKLTTKKRLQTLKYLPGWVKLETGERWYLASASLTVTATPSGN